MVKKDNQFLVRVESNIIKTVSYLVTASSKAKAMAMVKSGSLTPDNTDYDQYKEDDYEVCKLSDPEFRANDNEY